MRWQRRISLVEAHAEGEVGRVITGGVLDVAHPENAAIRDVTFAYFVAPIDGEPGAWRNAIVVSPGRLDRCPCGTGCSARLAALTARGAIERGQRIMFRSLIGSRFETHVARETTVAGRPAVIPAIEGRGWIVATHEFGVDPTDPFPQGFTLSETWGDGMTGLN